VRCFLYLVAAVDEEEVLVRLELVEEVAKEV
jgi:hypothetical protein